MRLGLPHRGRGSLSHRTRCPQRGNHHPGEGSVLQHARPDEVPEKGFQRGHLCGGYRRPCGPEPPGGQLQVHPRGEIAVCHPRRRSAAQCSVCRAGPGVQPGPHRAGQPRGRLPGVGPHHPAQKLPCQPEYAVFLYQWALCPQPHHDGGHGNGVQGHHDAGQVPWRNLASGNAVGPGGCQRAPGQNGSPLRPRE